VIATNGAEEILLQAVSIRASAFVDWVSGATGAAEPEGATVSSAIATLASTHPTARTTWSLRRATLVVGVAGAAAATVAAALFHAAGVSFDVDGEIPLAGFAQLTFLGALAGGLIAAVVKRLSVDPARRFVQVAAALTAVSCIPSIALSHDIATKLALVATHLLAAAIIVPVLARKLDA
jgi:hypothetical protein